MNKTGAQQLVANSSLDVDGDFTLLSGTFFCAEPRAPLSVAGDFTRTGTFDARSSVVVFDGATNATLIDPVSPSTMSGSTRGRAEVTGSRHPHRR